MNIEEERKAFEEKAYPNASAVNFDGEKYSPRFNSDWQHGVSEHANRMFPVWLAAKAHAEEMAKPQATPACDYDGEWWIYSLAGRVGNGAASKEEAVQWAKDNGYRVVSE